MKYVVFAIIAAVMFVPAAHADHPVPSLAQVADIVFGTTVTVSSGTHVVSNQIVPTQFLTNADGTVSLRPSLLTASVSVSHNTDVGTVVRTADKYGEFGTAGWVNTLAGAWLDGDMSDELFVESMQFAVDHGAVRVDVSDTPTIVALVEELDCTFVSATVTKCGFLPTVAGYAGVLEHHEHLRPHIRDYQKIIDLHARISEVDAENAILRAQYEALLP